MKIAIALATLATFVTAGMATALALASPRHEAAAKTLNIVMHDPGCHWFQIGARFTTTATVSGAVRLVNLDEAALKVASRHGLRRIPVGKSIVVDRGKYGITMVGQASDDNHLKLTVR
jgi:hypothetical protein